MTASMEVADLGLLVGTLIGGLGALGAFVWTMFRIARGVAQINRAVNHQEPDEPVLVERVKSIEARFDAHDERAAARFDAHDERAAALGERVQRLEVLGTTRHDEVRAGLAAVEKALRSHLRATKIDHGAPAPKRRA